MLESILISLALITSVGLVALLGYLKLRRMRDMKQQADGKRGSR